MPPAKNLYCVCCPGPFPPLSTIITTTINTMSDQELSRTQPNPFFQLFCVILGQAMKKSLNGDVWYQVILRYTNGRSPSPLGGMFIFCVFRTKIIAILSTKPQRKVCRTPSEGSIFHKLQEKVNREYWIEESAILLGRCWIVKYLCKIYRWSDCWKVYIYKYIYFSS